MPDFQGYLAKLKQNTIVRGPIFSEPVQVIVSQLMGNSVKLTGKGLETGRVHELILNADQLATLKFTPEKAAEWVQKRTHKDCPVCTRIDEVGLLTAAQRLYKQYGADVLEVIEGHQLPPTKDGDKKDYAQTYDQTANIILANKAAIENLRPLLAIFEAS